MEPENLHSKTELNHNIEELISEIADLSAFSSERNEQSELLFNLLARVLNRVHGVQMSLRFWKLILEDHLLADLISKDGLKESRGNVSAELFPIINSPNFPAKKEKQRNILGHLNNLDRDKYGSILSRPCPTNSRSVASDDLKFIQNTAFSLVGTVHLSQKKIPRVKLSFK